MLDILLHQPVPWYNFSKDHGISNWGSRGVLGGLWKCENKDSTK